MLVDSETRVDFGWLRGNWCFEGGRIRGGGKLAMMDSESSESLSHHFRHLQSSFRVEK